MTHGMTLGMTDEVQVASKPTAEKVVEIINSVMGPIKIILRKGDDCDRLFIPKKAVDDLQKANIWPMLGLSYEEEVLTDPNLRVFRV